MAMKNRTVFLSLFILFRLTSLYSQALELLIPAPKQVIEDEGYSLVLEQPISIYVTNEAKDFAQGAKWLLKECPQSQLVATKNKATICYEIDNQTTPSESGQYRLSIQKTTITVSSNSSEGFFNATATLLQLHQLVQASYKLHCAKIIDFPDFPYRGYLLDCGRNFISIEKLKESISVLAKYKINLFQWHLSDNPGYRIESDLYPQLNKKENYRPTRDPGKFYSYKEIKELFLFAKEKGVLIVPEIDMPGHSTYFKTTFNTTMNSLRGTKICKNLLQEFCDHIPASLAPIIHIGTDEVRVPNPKSFINQIVKVLTKNGRDYMVWHPGLTKRQDAILQVWDNGKAISTQKNIDSNNFYINNTDPIHGVEELFNNKIFDLDFSLTDKPLKEFHKHYLGVIGCIWHDVNVDDEDEIFLANCLYPTMIAVAARGWNNRTFSYYQAPQKEEKNLTLAMLLAAECEAYTKFENQLAVHRDKLFIPQKISFTFTTQKEGVFKISPLNHKISESEIKQLSNDNQFYKNYTKEWNTINGKSILLKGRWNQKGPYKTASVGDSLVLTSKIYANQATSCYLIAGFDTPLRPNRQFSGVPKNGEFSPFNCAIYLNGKKIDGPTYKKPNSNFFPHKALWNKPEEEIPWTNEELYWLKEAIPITLKAGENTIVVTTTLGYKDQYWVSAVMLVDIKENGYSYFTEPQDIFYMD